MRLTYLRGEQRHEAGIRGGRIGVGIQDLPTKEQAKLVNLLGMGIRLSMAGQDKEALRALKEGVALAEAADELEHTAMFRQTVGDLYKFLGQCADAISHYRQALYDFRGAE